MSHIDFYDKDNGIATGNSCILRTRDGGKTWVSQARNHPNMEIGMWGVQFLSVHSALVCNFQFDIIRWDDTPLPSAVEESASIERNSILIYPNPATSTVCIRNLTDGGVNLSIVDLLGNAVLSLSSSESVTTIDVNAVPRGAYFLRVIREGKATSLPLILE